MPEPEERILIISALKAKRSDGKDAAIRIADAG